jgi:hypothetical protein
MCLTAEMALTERQLHAGTFHLSEEPADRCPMTARKNSFPRRGTEPYAILHAQEIAREWGITAAVVQRDGIFFCIVGGTPLQGAELVGHAVPGGGMFVYEGALAA